uniref:WGS project CAEQ00000000 data, annotated contig 367 n=1 Tax=Trypanosoma congolense (strain IL3000) TaxID=1068625 RepID=F9WFB5_TRYCI|nr:unnamed protein product [Trypanosoma congolense IL3000]
MLHLVLPTPFDGVPKTISSIARSVSQFVSMNRQSITGLAALQTNWMKYEYTTLCIRWHHLEPDTGRNIRHSLGHYFSSSEKSNTCLGWLPPDTLFPCTVWVPQLNFIYQVCWINQLQPEANQIRAAGSMQVNTILHTAPITHITRVAASLRVVAKRAYMMGPTSSRVDGSGLCHFHGFV